MGEFQFTTNWVFFAWAILCGAVATVAIRHFAIKNGIVNNPNPIVPQHNRPVAYLGGVGVFFGVILALGGLYCFAPDRLVLPSSWPVLCLGGSVYLVWGIVDDLTQLRPLPKFWGQLMIATLVVYWGLRLDFFQFPWLDSIFSVFWIVFIVNALNFTDVCDGLVGSITSVVFLFVALLGMDTPFLYLIISGSIIGFLFFNWPKASIFLGDAGSHFLGFVLVFFCIQSSNGLTFFNSIIYMSLIVCLPIFELIFITSVRIKKGLPWWKGSPDHFSLRMQKRGYSRKNIDLASSFISILGIIFANAFRIPSFHTVKYIFPIALLILFGFFTCKLIQWEDNSKGIGSNSK